jgi:iron complex transport system permease protein
VRSARPGPGEPRGASVSAAQRLPGARWGALGAALALLAGVLILATGVGSVALGPLEVLRGVAHGLSGQLSGTGDTIVWQIRLPRVLLAAFVGGSLAVSGATYQGVFRNPLADPYLLGVASGAGLGATLALLFGAGRPWPLSSVPLMSFAFALLAVLATLLLARRRGGTPLVALILAGVVLGSSATALTSLLMLSERDDAARVLAWLLGSFGLASWAQLASVLPFALLALGVMLASARGLNVMQLGEASAAQLGLRVLVAAATLATAAAVSVAGIIGFVGLIVPHAVRLAAGPDHRALLPLSLLYGAVFMVLADLAARTLLAPAEVPIGVITALVGGPVFLWLLRRQV